MTTMPIVTTSSRVQIVLEVQAREERQGKKKGYKDMKGKKKKLSLFRDDIKAKESQGKLP